MTLAQTGGSAYDARIRRAERLAARYPFAAEFLDLYRSLASFQSTLFQLAASSAKHAEKAAQDLRGDLDLTLLLPRFRGFLSLVEQKGPAALAESARQISALPSDSWVSLLNAYWTEAGRGDQQVGAFAQFFPRAFLQPYAELLASQAPKPPLAATSLVCPLCGSRPLLGVLRPEGDGGKRFLLCSFCSYEWDFRRILCPVCAEEQENKLPVYVAEQFPHVRVETCDTCRFYLRSIDLTKDGNAVPLVDDLAAIPLTLWAHERGYSRLQPNLLGT
ncbi:MAG: formate dehydrogenase accessory protein FdhE [Candidatus Acidiferrales bacterium]